MTMGYETLQQNSVGQNKKNKNLFSEVGEKVQEEFKMELLERVQVMVTSWVSFQDLHSHFNNTFSNTVTVIQ